MKQVLGIVFRVMCVPGGQAPGSMQVGMLRDDIRVCPVQTEDRRAETRRIVSEFLPVLTK